MEDFLKWLEQRVESLRQNAAMTGSMTDGGAHNLQEQIQIYRSARSGIIPKPWQKLHDEYERELDPEYAEYQRLQKKFEGRK